MKQVSLDIETLGTKPGAVILSIGAVLFNIDGPISIGHSTVFSRNVSVWSCLDAGLTIDPDTLAWWKSDKVTPEARDALNYPYPMPLADAAKEFGEWYKGTGAEKVWAKPPSFDCELLDAAFRAVGVDVPWGFRDMLDLRTLLHVSGFNDKSHPMAPGLVEHIAIDDAVHQASIIRLATEHMK